MRKLETLQRLSEFARIGRFGNAEVTDFVDMLHKLAGSAGIFGDVELGQRAQSLELSLGSWDDSEMLEKTRSAVAALQAVA